MMIGVDLRRCTDKKVEIIAYHMARQQNCDLESRTIRQQSSMDKSNGQQQLRQLASWRCEYTAGKRRRRKYNLLHEGFFKLGLLLR
jgi:outer membrane receptor for ferrienterochelin and colicin